MQAESYMGLQTAAVPSPVALPGSLTVLHTDNLPTDKKLFIHGSVLFPCGKRPSFHIHKVLIILIHYRQSQLLNACL